MMSTRREKIIAAFCALVLLVVAMGLIAVGPFLPHWAAVKNTTESGNVSYSLWARHECFGIICTTTQVRVQWNHQECWENVQLRKEECRKTTGYKMRADTTCKVANYCNSTWIGEGDFDNVPSLLFVAKAFETPAAVSALLSIFLFVVKIILLVKKPTAKRLHLKAAYLTFGAVAGFAAVVGMAIFCLMLDKEKYSQGWAPYLTLAGGVLYVLFGVGGYLSWRNSAAEDFDDDRSEFDNQFADVKTSTRPFIERQSSSTVAKAVEAQV